MTERFTAPQAGWYSRPTPPEFEGLPEGSTTVVTFDTIEWQTNAPPHWARGVPATARR